MIGLECPQRQPLGASLFGAANEIASDPTARPLWVYVQLVEILFIEDHDRDHGTVILDEPRFTLGDDNVAKPAVNVRVRMHDGRNCGHRRTSRTEIKVLWGAPPFSPSSMAPPFFRLRRHEQR